MERDKLLRQLDELKSAEKTSKVQRYNSDGSYVGEQEITANQFIDPPAEVDPYDFEFDPSEVDSRKQQYAEAVAAQAKAHSAEGNSDSEDDGPGKPKAGKSDSPSQGQADGNSNNDRLSEMTKQSLEELQKQLDEAKAECSEALKNDPDNAEMKESQKQLEQIQGKLDEHKQALEQQQQNQSSNDQQQSGQQQKTDQLDADQQTDEQTSQRKDQETGEDDEKSKENADQEDPSQKEEDPLDKESEQEQQKPKDDSSAETQSQQKPEPKEEEKLPPELDYYKPYWYNDLKNLVNMGFDVLLCGPAGCGKSRAGREVGKEIKKPGNTYAFRAGMRKADLLYSKELRGGDSVVELSPLMHEVKKPLVTVIDEALSVDPEVLICFNGLLESSQRCVDTPVGEVVRDKEHRFILTSNTDGRSESRIYRAPQMQDASILSRVMVMNVDYDEEVEKNIAYSSGAKDWKYIIHNTHALRKAVRKADMVMDISTRWITQACKLNKAGVARNKALAMAMLDRFTENELKKLQGMGTTIDFSGASKLQK